MLTLTRGLWVWAGGLALMLVLAILPLRPWGQIVTTQLILLAVAIAWVFSGRRAARQSNILHLAEGQELPPNGYRQPVVVVCGDGLDGLFGSATNDRVMLRLTEQGCYLRVPSSAQLPQVIDAVLSRRPHWGMQLSVVCVVNPAEQADQAMLAGQLRGFRHQLAIARERGVALPLLLISYQRGCTGEGAWFTWEVGKDGLAVREANACVELAYWESQSSERAVRAARLQASVHVGSAAQWLEQRVVSHLLSRDQRDSACPPVACAVALIPGLACVRHSLWGQWRQGKTGLAACEGETMGSYAVPFPDPLLHLLPTQSENTPVKRAGLCALWLFVMAGCIGLTSSAWQNHLLLRQVSDDLIRYQAIPQPEHRAQPEFALKEKAVAVLRKEAARLDGHYREGAPLSLGLGLYAGDRLRPPLRAAIAAYREPPLPPEQTALKISDPVRLDSLSLFASGSAELKPGSTKVLISALVDIKAQPGWLIVIAGHTDITGDAQRNLLLSRARAGAVRDWMQRMGDIPDSCFAVQGFGANQPISSNDTPEGRAANRRVDIRLVPEAGACALPTQVMGGQPPSRRLPATNLHL